MSSKSKQQLVICPGTPCHYQGWLKQGVGKGKDKDGGHRQALFIRARTRLKAKLLKYYWIIGESPSSVFRTRSTSARKSTDLKLGILFWLWNFCWCFMLLYFTFYTLPKKDLHKLAKECLAINMMESWQCSKATHQHTFLFSPTSVTLRSGRIALKVHHLSLSLHAQLHNH